MPNVAAGKSKEFSSARGGTAGTAAKLLIGEPTDPDLLGAGVFSAGLLGAFCLTEAPLKMVSLPSSD